MKTSRKYSAYYSRNNHTRYYVSKEEQDFHRVSQNIFDQGWVCEIHRYNKDFVCRSLKSFCRVFYENKSEFSVEHGNEIKRKYPYKVTWYMRYTPVKEYRELWK